MRPQVLAPWLATEGYRSTDLLAVDSCPSGTVAPMLGRQGLIGVLVAAAGLDRLPPTGWPIEATLELLVHDERIRPTPGSPLSLAVDRWAQPGNAARSRFPALGLLLRALVAAGHLTPRGAGQHARLEIHPDWRESHRHILDLLSDGDRRSLLRAGQRLAALTSSSNTR